MTGPVKLSSQFAQLATSNKTTSELIQRLKAVHAELKSMEQENVDLISLEPLNGQLVRLTEHKDKGVLAFVGCILADLLRLFAPNAPFNASELACVFETFVKCLETGIDDITGAYFPFYSYLLESLSTYKSIVLVMDLQQADQLMHRLFSCFFTKINEKHPRNISACMVDILHQLVEESGNLSMDIVELILSQFNRAQKIQKPLAYKMASDLVKLGQDRLQYYVSQYFADEIVQPGGGNETSASGNLDLESLRATHELILELHRVCDGVLLSVIPQLETELKVENIEMRTLATKVLGEIFCEENSLAAKQYPAVWLSWIQKKDDKNIAIRLLWLDYCGRMLKFHSDKSSEINEFLCKKLYDPEDRVRSAVIGVVKALVVQQKDTATLANISKSLLEEIAARTKDKRIAVRHEAIETLSRVYQLTYQGMSADQAVSTIEKYGWIPSALISSMYTMEPDVIIDVEKAFDEEIFPSVANAEERARRLLLVFSLLDKKARAAFLAMLFRQRRARSLFQSFLSTMVENGSKTEMEKFISSISADSPEPNKTTEALRNFIKAKDNLLVKTCQALLQSEYPNSLKLQRETVKRIEQLFSNASYAGTSKSLAVLMRRITSSIFDPSLISNLLETYSKMVDENAASADAIRYFLQEIAKHDTVAFKDCLIQIRDELCFSNNQDLILDGLFLLRQSLIRQPGQFIVDSDFRVFLDRCVSGEYQPKIAKYAADILCQTATAEELDEWISLDLVRRLRVEDFHGSRIALVCLSQCTNFNHSLIKKNDKLVLDFIYKDLLMCNKQSTDGDEDQWIEDEYLAEECHCKVAALKFITKRVISQLTLDRKEATESVKSAIKILFAFLSASGDVTKAQDTCEAHKTRLRLCAAVNIMKIVRNIDFEKSLSLEYFQMFAMMIQDPCYQVRATVIEKLIDRLGRCELHFRYLNVLLLTVFEPETELKIKVKSFLVRVFDRQGVIKENLLPRLVHLIAHYQDFDRSDMESLQEASKYFEFYLELVANQENVSFLYSIAGKLKTVKDRHGATENIYVLCELMQYLIQEKSRAHGWPLTPYPGTIDLPSALFLPLKDSKSVNSVIKQSFLPQEFLNMKKKSSTLGAVLAIQTAPYPSKVKSSKKSQRKADDRDDDETQSDGSSNAESESEAESGDEAASVDRDGFAIPKISAAKRKAPVATAAEAALSGTSRNGLEATMTRSGRVVKSVKRT